MNLFKLFGIIAVKNDEANEAIDETVGKAESAQTRMSDAFGKIGSVTKKVGTAGVAIATVAAGWIYNLAENTREYRTEMGKLDTAFTTSGNSSETARDTYKKLQSVLGDTSKAVEAANHLAKLTTNEKDLQTWTDICTGVFATFGDSLPIEGLTEAANETAKVGEVTGPLADALNWAGIKEDDFNKKLAACTTEQERQKLIMDTLNGVYKTAAEEYKNINEKVIASNAAHDNLNAAMAKLGDAAEPAITMVINAVAKLAESATPVVEAISNAVIALGDAWVDLKAKMTDIYAKITVQTNNQAAAVSNVGSSVTKATGSSFLGNLAQTIAQSSSVNPDAPWMPNWNAEGAIFSRPTIFDTRLGFQGVGEAGPEAVAPISKLQQYVADAVRGTVGGMSFNVVLDSGALVGQLAPRMDAQLGTLASRKGRRNG